MRLLTCLLLCLPLLANAAEARWKWRDANGQVQYSDRPPPAGTPDKDILARPVTAPVRVQVTPLNAPKPAASEVKPPKPAASSVVERAAANDKARAEAAKKAEAEAKAAEDRRLRAENCSAARNQLASLQSGQRLFQANDRGERIAMDDAARAAAQRRAQELIASNCN